MTFHEYAEVMKKGQWYVIAVKDGDIEKCHEDYQRKLEELGIGRIRRWYRFLGKNLNSEYGLTGENRLPENCPFLAFPRFGLDIEKLEAFRGEKDDYWFDDIAEILTTRKEQKRLFILLLV